VRAILIGARNVERDGRILSWLDFALHEGGPRAFSVPIPLSENGEGGIPWDVFVDGATMQIADESARAEAVLRERERP
jgi:hypothetical protein